MALLRRRGLECLAAGTQQKVICSICNVTDGDVYRLEVMRHMTVPLLKDWYCPEQRFEKSWREGE